MEIAIVLAVCAAVFGLCYFVDKGFTALFRSRTEHKTGMAVHQNKRYASFGLIIMVIGVAALFRGTADGWLLPIGGGILLLLGAAMVIYYLTFGIFYDTDTFILSTFGKRSSTYRYQQILGQQLYVSYGTVIVELHMDDGRTVQLQSKMDGAYPFLDKAYDAWLRQTGRDPQECTFHDPANSCWFPPMEE